MHYILNAQMDFALIKQGEVNTFTLIYNQVILCLLQHEWHVLSHLGGMSVLGDDEE